MQSVRNGLVLLSGGLDSTAALHLALERCTSVQAIGFDYGQPHRVELVHAGRLAKKRGVPYTQLVLGESVRGDKALCVPIPGRAANGVSHANMPGRNAVFLSVAAAHAVRLWPAQDIVLVIGCNADDAEAFPDCKAHFIRAQESALAAAMGPLAQIAISAPWVERDMRKADIVRWCSSRPEALADIRESMSCYFGSNCGTCDACILRACAFAANAPT